MQSYDYLWKYQYKMGLKITSGVFLREKLINFHHRKLQIINILKRDWRKSGKLTFIILIYARAHKNNKERKYTFSPKST